MCILEILIASHRRAITPLNSVYVLSNLQWQHLRTPFKQRLAVIILLELHSITSLQT